MLIRIFSQFRKKIYKLGIDFISYILYNKTIKFDGGDTMKKVFIKDFGEYYNSVTILHGSIIYVVIHKRVSNNMCYGGTKEMMSRSRKEIARFIKNNR